jgi:hypothetical protein
MSSIEKSSIETVFCQNSCPSDQEAEVIANDLSDRCAFGIFECRWRRPNDAATAPGVG